ncbi:three-helix bundle dimerization domain-containing protein [Streptomyces sp. NPDC101062]
MDAARSGDRAAEESASAHRAHAEQVALHYVTVRLRTAFPSVGHDTVDALVRAAHDALRHAKVRTYIPILVERRVRNTLASTPTNTAPPNPTAPPRQAETDPA